MGSSAPASLPVNDLSEAGSRGGGGGVSVPNHRHCTKILTGRRGGVAEGIAPSQGCLSLLGACCTGQAIVACC